MTCQRVAPRAARSDQIVLPSFAEMQARPFSGKKSLELPRVVKIQDIEPVEVQALTVESLQQHETMNCGEGQIK